MSAAASRIAGAPISWGVCEVPGWGYQLPPDRVLADMHALGLTATEFGPDGFLPRGSAEKAAILRRHGLEAVGGFVPAVLHDEAGDPLPLIDRVLDDFAAAHARVLVLAAATGLDGYDERPRLSSAGWRNLLTNLDRIAARAAQRGVLATLHPHVGTVVERPDEVDRVLAGSAISLCLDSGHLLIGGTDPAELARRAGGRVAHTHLKDVEASWAERVRSGEVSYAQAVARGMYRPLGQGDVDIVGLIEALTAVGYQGWYVLEQDTVLGREPEGEGPVTDVRASLTYLRSLC